VKFQQIAAEVFFQSQADPVDRNAFPHLKIRESTRRPDPEFSRPAGKISGMEHSRRLYQTCKH